MKDKIQEYALIAEIAGGIAIVISLLFVGLQIRQNSQISEVNAYQNLISQISLMNTLRVENPQFAELYSRFDNGEEPKNQTERAQIEAFLYMVFRHGDLAYRQFEKGLIDEESLISVLAPVRSFLNTETGKDIWATLADSLQADYIEFIDDLGLYCEEYTGTGTTC